MNILIASSISQDSIEQLRQKHDVVCAFNAPEDKLKSLIRDREALVFRSGVNITADVMTCAPHLGLLIRAGSGTENVDLNYVRIKGLTLHRIPEPGAKAVAELSFGLMLALTRNIIQADGLLRKGRWAKNELAGYLLTGKILGIIGAGNIGSRVGRLGAAWGMTVVGCVKHPSPERSKQLEKIAIRLEEFDEVISSSDFISIHVPLDDSTRNLINRETFSHMKRGTFLVNLARGGVVDEKALHKALSDDGMLRGAALDVHENEGEGKISPLAELPNVILTPHIGAQTIDSQREIGERIIETVDSYVPTRKKDMKERAFNSLKEEEENNVSQF